MIFLGANALAWAEESWVASVSASICSSAPTLGSTGIRSATRSCPSPVALTCTYAIYDGRKSNVEWRQPLAGQHPVAERKINCHRTKVAKSRFGCESLPGVLCQRIWAIASVSELLAGFCHL